MGVRERGEELETGGSQMFGTLKRSPQGTFGFVTGGQTAIMNPDEALSSR